MGSTVERIVTRLAVQHIACINQYKHMKHTHTCTYISISSCSSSSSDRVSESNSYFPPRRRGCPGRIRHISCHLRLPPRGCQLYPAHREKSRTLVCSIKHRIGSNSKPSTLRSKESRPYEKKKVRERIEWRCVSSPRHFIS